MQVKVAELERGNQKAVLYSNPLGRACYMLNREQAQKCVVELKQGGLLEAGLVFASEVRPAAEDRQLSSKEWRYFRAEVGCPPLLLACAACANELTRLREELQIQGDSSKNPKEKEVQLRAVEVLRLLAQHGAWIAAADVGPDGSTALHVAAKVGAPQLLSALLQLDADLKVRDNEGMAPEGLAQRSGNVTCHQILEVAAMLDLEEKQETLLKEIEGEEAKKTEQKKKGKDRRRRKKKQKKKKKRVELQSAPSVGSDSEDSEAESEEEEEELEEEELEVAPARPPPAEDGQGSEQGGQGRPRDAEEEERAQAAYGKNSMWSKLDEDYYPEDWQDDAELPDEWDTEKWGEYVDMGEDWDEDSSRSASASDAASGDDDDNEVRAEVARLRREKRAQLQQLYDIAVDREARIRETEHAERQGKRLAEHARRLEDREARMKAGDPQAAEDLADEVETSSLWETIATTRAQVVWEQEKTLGQQQKEHKEAISALQKQLRAMKRRTKGLEVQWAWYFEWQRCKETLDKNTGDHWLFGLAEDIEQLVDALGVDPELQAQLPPILLSSEDGRPALPPRRELLVALEVHSRLQSEHRLRELRLCELADLCNEQLRAKDEETLTAVEQELVHRAFPDMEDEDNLEGWARLADLASSLRQALEQLSRRRQPPRPPASGPQMSAARARYR